MPAAPLAKGTSASYNLATSPAKELIRPIYFPPYQYEDVLLANTSFAGLIVTASILIAAGIAVYENPQIQEWIESQRRRIAQAFYADPANNPQTGPSNPSNPSTEKTPDGPTFQRQQHHHRSSPSFDDYVTNEGTLRSGVELPNQLGGIPRQRHADPEKSGGSNPVFFEQPDLAADEAFARALQAEEDALAGQPLGAEMITGDTSDITGITTPRATSPILTPTSSPGTLPISPSSPLAEHGGRGEDDAFFSATAFASPPSSSTNPSPTAQSRSLSSSTFPILAPSPQHPQHQHQLELTHNPFLDAHAHADAASEADSERWSTRESDAGSDWRDTDEDADALFSDVGADLRSDDARADEVRSIVSGRSTPGSWWSEVGSVVSEEEVGGRR
ncbi:MAG: hypothetical protein M1824_005976 [Vezdaea acicularis]|nr:MAG: hypothetical protein M1824_005976 [Vezdaea acicularis]